MLRRTMMLIALLAVGSVSADDKAQQEPANKTAKAEKVAATGAKAVDAKATDAKTLAGISILGNQEAPKSLVIVPWKGSEIGDMPGLSRLLDDSVQPVDKDVFMRELSYYEIRQSH
jgi:hypothetical protein